jgi:metallo-beta-lactamase class B
MLPRVCTHPWEFAVEPFRIAGNLYYAGNSDVSAHLIATHDGLILIDSTYPQTLYLLLESIRRLGFDPAAIRWILHSHGHYDHVGGTRALVELTHAQTALGAPDVAIVTRRPELSWAPEYGVQFNESFAVDRPLADGDMLKVGETTVHCVAMPGHTPGAMAYFFAVHEGGRTYRAGFHGGAGLNTLAREYLDRYGLPLSRRADYLKSLRRLQPEPVDICITSHPAHNHTLGKRAAWGHGQNPFIDRAAWPALLADLDLKFGRAFTTPA